MSDNRVVWGGLMTCGVVLLVGIAAVVALFLTCVNSMSFH
jgi:hypothetical protein